MRTFSYCAFYALIALSAAATAGALLTIDFHWLHERRAAERLYADKEYAAAVEALDAVAANAPDAQGKTECLSLAAIAVARTGDYEQALARAAALADDQYQRYTRLVILSIRDEHEEIVREFENEPIADWPDRIRARGFTARADALHAVGRTEDAIGDYELSVEASGSNTAGQLATLNRIASLYGSLDQNDRARETYERIVAICGDDPRNVRGSHVVYPRALLALANMMVEEQRYADAIECLAPYDPEWSVSMGLTVIDRRGDIYLEWGKQAEALATWQEGLEFAEKRKAHSRAPGFITRFEEKIAEVQAKSAN